MDMLIKVTSANDETQLRALYDWLLREDDLRAARVAWMDVEPEAEKMGALSDTLVVSLGAGGVGVAFIQSLATWLRTRGTDIRLKLTGPHGEIEVTAKQVHDPKAFVEHFQSIIKD
jgi:hypothetical protein